MATNSNESKFKSVKLILALFEIQTYLSANQFSYPSSSCARVSR